MDDKDVKLFCMKLSKYRADRIHKTWMGENSIGEDGWITERSKELDEAWLREVRRYNRFKREL